MRALALALAAVTASVAVAGQQVSPIDKALHKNLHVASTEPGQPPPPYVLDEADQARLDANEMVFHFEHIKGHDLAFAAVTSWADTWSIWQSIKALDEYPEYLPALTEAKLADPRQQDGWEALHGRIFVDVPVLPGAMELQGAHHMDRGFLSFHLVKGKKSPFKHGMGYWSVTDYKDDRRLVLLMIDVLPAFPLPVSQRGPIAESVMPPFLWAMARRAERQSNERRRFLDDVE